MRYLTLIICVVFITCNNLEVAEMALKGQKEYYDDGSLKKFTYEEKELIYESTFHRNGNMRSRIIYDSSCQYKDTITYWYDNGDVERIMPTKNGSVEGIVTSYYIGSNVESQTVYSEGLKSGRATFYSQNGRVKAKNYYLIDSLIYRSVFNNENPDSLILENEIVRPYCRINNTDLNKNDTLVINFGLPILPEDFLKGRSNFTFNYSIVPLTGDRVIKYDGENKVEFHGGKIIENRFESLEEGIYTIVGSIECSAPDGKSIYFDEYVMHFEISD